MSRRYVPTKSRTVDYCFKRLAQDIHPVDREVIERKLEQVGPHCRVCGRRQESPESIRRWKQDGYGSECRTKAVA